MSTDDVKNINQLRFSAFELQSPECLAEVRTALDELEVRIRRGDKASCESIFVAFPQICQDKEAVLEVIYTEFVLRQELGQELKVNDWINRFPQWSHDLEELFQVHDLVSHSAPLTQTSTQQEIAHWLNGASGPEPRIRVGNYEVIEELGRGSMGEVFLARHVTLDRLVAIKTINERDADTPQALERFRIEAEASAKLQHPNIVQIYEVGLHHHVPYFAMEYVAGGTLAQAIHLRPINARNAARLTETLARAIHFAHEQGIVHRDLKPANILLMQSDRPTAVALEFSTSSNLPQSTGTCYEPKITDFGLAKRLGAESERTLPGHAIGTPSYMAPEQSGGSVVATGPHSDIYSLGAVLYDMLVGRPPFLAPTVAETLHKVLNQEPVALRSLQANVPRDLEVICLKCLHKSPDQRYATAVDLADDIKRFLNGIPICARPAGLAEQTFKSMRRHPLVTVFVVMLALGVVAFASQWWRAEEHRATAERETLNAVRAREEEVAERHRLERVLYAHDISLAKLEYLSNHTTRSKQLLSKWASDQPQWEWRYLQHTCHQELCDFDEFKLPCWSIAISPDGKLVAAASAIWGIDHESSIKVWTVDSQELLYTLRGHSSSIMDIEFSPDGRYLASIGMNWRSSTPAGRVCVWDLQLGTEVWTDSKASGHCVAYSPDGTKIATGGSFGTITLYESGKGNSLVQLKGHKRAVHDLSFRPDGRYLISASRDGSARLWNVENHTQAGLVEGLVDVRRANYSPNGSQLVLGLYTGTSIVYRQDAESLIETDRFAEAAPVGALRFTPDGQSIAVSYVDRSIKLLNSKTLGVTREIHGHNGNTYDVSFDSEGTRMASTGEDGHVRVWNLSNLVNPDQSRRHELPGPHFVDSAFLLDSNRVVLALGENTNRGGTPSEFAAKVYDVNSQKFLNSYTGHQDWLTCLSLDPRQRWIATGSRDKTVRLFDLHNRDLLHKLEGHSDVILAIAALENGQAIATISADGTMKLWNTQTGTSITQWTLPEQTNRLAAQACSSFVATANRSGIISLWREGSLIPVATTRIAIGEIQRLCFDPTGNILTGATRDGKIQLWDVARLLKGDSTPLAILLGHTESVSSIAFTPDGSRLASCSTDRTVRLWDVQSQEEVLSLRAETSARSQVLFSGDGKRLLCVNQNIINEWTADSSPNSDHDRTRALWHFNEYLTAVKNNRLQLFSTFPVFWTRRMFKSIETLC